MKRFLCANVIADLVACLLWLFASFLFLYFNCTCLVWVGLATSAFYAGLAAWDLWFSCSLQKKGKKNNDSLG